MPLIHKESFWVRGDSSETSRPPNSSRESIGEAGRCSVYLLEKDRSQRRADISAEHVHRIDMVGWSPRLNSVTNNT